MGLTSSVRRLRGRRRLSGALAAECRTAAANSAAPHELSPPHVLMRAHARFTARLRSQLRIFRTRRRAVPRRQHRLRSFLTVHVPTTTYTSKTTWTLANSPYVLDGNLTVAATRRSIRPSLTSALIPAGRPRPSRRLDR